VQITPPEDCRLRYKGGWRSVMEYTYAQLKALYSSPTWTAFASSPQAGGYIESGTPIPDWSNGATQAPNVVRFFIQAAGVRPSLEETYSPAFGPQLILTLNSLQPADTAIIRIWVERYAVTDLDLLEGPQWLQPRVGSDVVAYVQRLFHFSPVTAKQRYEVRSVWYENHGTERRLENPANNPNIPDLCGLPYACHANETLRLLDAWVVAGKP
jgi:hypothetical protein